MHTIVRKFNIMCIMIHNYFIIKSGKYTSDIAIQNYITTINEIDWILYIVCMVYQIEIQQSFIETVIKYDNSKNHIYLFDV